MRALKRLAPWFLLGPITGPLAEGVYRNLRKNEPVLASLYALAIPVTWIDLVAAFLIVTTRSLHPL
jgi:hypothetical protein